MRSHLSGNSVENRNKSKIIMMSVGPSWRNGLLESLNWRYEYEEVKLNKGVVYIIRNMNKVNVITRP